MTEAIRLRRRPVIGEPVRLHNQYRDCVAFLRVNSSAGSSRPVATAFLVHVPLTGDQVDPYLVTAAHVVLKARARNQPLSVRVNRGDEWDDLEIPDMAWHEHEASDVAIAEITLPADFTGNTIPIAILADDSRVEKYDIGEGDDVFMASLFTEFTGRKRDHPIVRFGSIALGRHESLTVKMPHAQMKMEGYLIEVRSWGGQSGSPVFVSFMGSSGYAEGREEAGAASLLGLMHGHYEIPAKIDFGNISNEAVFAEVSATAPVNAGIGIVMPAQKIIDLLMEDELVAKRAEKTKRLEEQEPTPVPDSVDDEDDSQFDRFEDLTEGLLRVPKKEIDEKRRKS